ncbi:MAG: hypothetical protein ACXVZJ_00440 [Terriglobales bacterium]
MRSSPLRSRRRQRGVALLLALFALLILSAIGLGMMYSANIETAVNRNYGGSMRAYYAALGGMEEVRDRIRSNTGTPLSAPPSTPTSSGGTIYIVNSYVNSAGNTITPNPWSSTDSFFDDEYCREFPSTNPGVGSLCTAAPFTGTNWYGYYNGSGTYTGSAWHSNGSVPSISPNTGTANALDFRWARIQMKTNYSTNPICVNGSGITCSTSASQGTAVCWNGSNEFLAPSNGTDCSGTIYKPVYMITSLAISPDGSRRMVQSELTQNIAPPLPAALVLDGSGPTYGTAHSSGFGITGVNANSCGASPTPANVPAIDTVNSTDQAYVAGQVFRPANYPGINPAPDIEVATSTQLGPYATIPGIVSVVQGLTSSADYVGTSPADLGSTASPKITVITGNYSSHSCTGSGILIVTGNLDCNGSWSWDGVLMVLGGTFLSHGGGGGHFNGAMLITKAYDATQTPPTAYTAASSAVPNYPLPGAPSWTWTGGGGNGITYDSCWTTALNQRFGFKVLSTRELSY